MTERIEDDVLNLSGLTRDYVDENTTHSFLVHAAKTPSQYQDLVRAIAVALLEERRKSAELESRLAKLADHERGRWERAAAVLGERVVPKGGIPE